MVTFMVYRMIQKKFLESFLEGDPGRDSCLRHTFLMWPGGELHAADNILPIDATGREFAKSTAQWGNDRPQGLTASGDGVHAGEGVLPGLHIRDAW